MPTSKPANLKSTQEATKMNIKLPKSVKYWAEIFKKEGESEISAIAHALQRAYEDGKLSDAQYDKIESLINA
jgi:hypothetical protein